MDFQLWTASESITVNNTTQPIDFSAKDVLIASVPEAVGRANGYSIKELKVRKELVALLEAADPEGTVNLTKEMTELLVKQFLQLKVPYALDNFIKLNDNLNQLYVSFSSSEPKSN